MRDASRHILFLATEFDAPGMHPYAINIINTMWQPGDHVLIVSRYGVEKQAFPDIPDESITWIDYPVGKLAKAFFRFRPTRVLQAINELIDKGDIHLIYSLTEEIILADSIRALQRRVPMLYTVHDANFHDYKASPLRQIKNRLIIARPQRLMLKRTVHQVTNSREQQQDITRRFPDHQVHYAPFPTLVNEAIARGGKTVEELQGVGDGYILFFGLLHLYKGVHLLYDTYLSHPELQARPLVIAGSRDIYFQRRPQDEQQRVVFINRFIDDSELRDLFGRAAVVVYPYISATQSGVASIASYFGKPMVLSDLPFFKQTCDGCDGIHFFAGGDSQALADAIGHAVNEGPVSTRPLYDREYSPQALRSTLDNIISTCL